MIKANSLSTVLAIMLMTTGCDSGGAALDEVESLTEERPKPEVADEPTKGAGETVPRNSSVKLAGSGLSTESIKKAETSLEFFLTLQELMEGYKADLLMLPINDILQCITTHEKSRDQEIERLDKSLSKDVSNAEKERRKQQREFRNRIEPPNYRIDYEWRTRHGFSRVNIYGCYDTDDFFWNNSKSRQTCYYSWRFRRVKYTADKTTFLYSNGPEPSPPELMIRMERQGIVAPEKVYCIVRDAYTKTRKDNPPVHWIDCETGLDSPNLRLRLTTPVDNLQVGDLVSVPVRNVFIAQGVVSREEVTAGRHAGNSWVVDAHALTLAITEARANCPARTAISAEICKHTDRKASALDLVRHCIASKNTETIFRKAQAWDKKRLRDKNEVMLMALEYLSEQRSLNLWVWQTLAKYRTLENDKAAALRAHARALDLADKPRDHLLIAEAVKRLGDKTLYRFAVQKACDNGLAAACRMVPK